MNYRPSALLLGLLLLSCQVMAEEKEAGEMPSLALLEFLGGWETDDGERIDPTELEDDGLLRQLGMSDDERESND